MKIKLLLVFFQIFCLQTLFAQVNLQYYLPDSLTYNTQIPAPKTILGYEIGEWHITHDQLVDYMETLDAMSNRITMVEYGRTYEKRPLVLMTITSPKNHQNIERLKAEHLDLTNPDKSANLDIENMPAVVYMGYSVHGNEASGGNAAALVAYYLAAAQGESIEKMLEHTIILLDPCFNPDGFQRFSTWVNMHKGNVLITDPNSREFEEPFPNGRTNHYWFDLNRDWLLAQHPESKGRLAKFHEWKPNVLTDHHEMGANSTFFFQPGVPSRINPITPKQNFDLTKELATFHAKALDDLGSVYYSKENFDDFFYGKGSTYPDINGGVGILFEQASSRGKAQETINGILTFPFTIRNQFTASLSTLRGVQSMRKKLLNYQRDFYAKELSVGTQTTAKTTAKAYIFGDKNDKVKNYYFLDILRRHQIEIQTLKEDIKADNQTFKKDSAFVVGLNQNQVKLIHTLFEKNTQFEDSLFYDISAWTLPLAFHLPYAALNTLPKGEKLETFTFPQGKIIGKESKVGYAFHWNNYLAPKALKYLLENNIKAKVSTQKTNFEIDKKTFEVNFGTVFVPAGIQQIPSKALFEMMQNVAIENGLDVFAMETGFAQKGVDLGSDANKILALPQTLLVVGRGVNANDAGEVWHLLDQRYEMPIALIEQDKLNTLNISRYNTIVMVSGNYGDINANGIENIKNWLKQGNTIIGMGTATEWLNQNGFLKINFKENPKEDASKNLPYADKEKTRGASEIGGAIFEVDVDLTHPLGYGFDSKKIPLFKDTNRFMLKGENPYHNPLNYTASPLLSGYISKKNLESLKNSSAVTIGFMGRGQVIALMDNPNFRGFWYGTNKLFANALFFGKILSR